MKGFCDICLLDCKYFLWSQNWEAFSSWITSHNHNNINRMCKIKWMFLFPINVFSIIQPLYSKRGSLKALLTWPILFLSSVLAASFLTRCWLSSSVEIRNCYSSCLLCQHLFASCSIWGENPPKVDVMFICNSSLSVYCVLLLNTGHLGFKSVFLMSFRVETAAAWHYICSPFDLV